MKNRIAFMVALGLLFLGSRALADDDPASPPFTPVAPPEPTPAVEEFYRSLEELGPRRAFQASEDLPPAEWLDLLTRISLGPRGLVAYQACGVLIRQGEEDASLPGLALLVASGRDRTELNGRMGYDWVHSDDDTLALRMSLKLTAYLLEWQPKFPPEERKRVERALMAGEEDTPFSPQSVRERIELLRRQLEQAEQRQRSE